MSVGEDQTECPLCMEPLEMDDINFFPCTCGYQICRFCWHRIRTDENGLCPACRKAYPEDPAEFKPLTEDELQRIKKERRQKEAQRKQKAAENRKHLANVRVVQKNLVFVVGLSQRLADPEVLKKHEYFGKFGKIHKVVINQSTSYAGAQVSGPSASAYVTYHRPEDALKAIQAVNNIHVDGRTLKASLGTTKYCSHFLRGAGCPKPDCMYLHELGEEAASFTKEEMQQGKHQEYEQKLYEQFMNSQNLVTTTVTPPVHTKQSTRKKTSSPELEPSPPSHTPPPQSTKEAWPSSQTQPSSTAKPDTLTNGSKASAHSSFSNSEGPHSQVLASKTDLQNAQNRAPGCHRTNGQHPDTINSKQKASSPELSPNSSSSGSGDCLLPSSSQQQFTTSRSSLPSLSSHQHMPVSSGGFPVRSGGLPPPPPPGLSAAVAAAVNRKLPFQTATDSMSLFSSQNGFPARPPKLPQHSLQPEESLPGGSTEIPDTHIPVSSSTDWQAAFGFSSSHTDTHDDDLGFDPWNESAKALAEIIEKESSAPAPPAPQLHNKLPYTQLQHSHSPHTPSSPPRLDHHTPQLLSNMQHISQLLDNRPKNLPPGFTPSHLGPTPNHHVGGSGSKIMNLMQMPSVPPHLANNQSNMAPFHDVTRNEMRQHDSVSPHDWQEGLRALLPNINISFGNQQQEECLQTNRSPQPPLQPPQHLTHKHWNTSSRPEIRPDVGWDPAIVTSGNVADYHGEEAPHWMASLHHLTEDTSALHAGSSSTSHQMPPLMHQLAYRSSGPSWPQKQTGGLGGGPGPSHPPPGFHNPQIRSHTPLTPEVSQLADGFQ